MPLNDEQRIAVKVTAEDATGPGLESAQSKMGKFKTVIGGVASALSGAGTASLVGALSDAARAGADEQASLERVKVAVENTNGTWDAQSAAILATVEAGRALGFHNQDLNDSFALLVEQTGSTAEAMSRIKVAEDLARGAHIDLYTASKLLGKATDENVNVLARYGIVVEKGADVTTMLADVEQKFGGQAKAYGDTTAGAIDKTRVSIEQWQAAIGNSLGPAQQYIALLPGFSAGLTLVGSGAGVAGKAIFALSGVTAAAAAPFIAVGIAIVAVGVALYEIKETIQLVIDNWEKFKIALTTGKLSDIPIFGFFFEKARQLLGVIDGIRNAWNALTSILGQQQAAPIVHGGGGGSGILDNGQGLATGGVVTRPTVALIGESGPEAVVPLSRAGGMGGTSIVINVGSVDSRSRVDDISDAVMRALNSQRQVFI